MDIVYPTQIKSLLNIFFPKLIQLLAQFTYFLGFFFELFDGTFVDPAAFVDQMASGRRFARVDVADDDNVDM